MNKKEQPSVSPEAKKFLKSEAQIEQMAREYDQAILDAAKEYNVMNLDLIELKDGKITIGGLEPKAWEALHNTSGTDYRKGQR